METLIVRSNKHKAAVRGVWPLLLGLGTLLALYGAPAVAETEGDRVAGPYRQGTVRIQGPGGEGFGFLVGGDARRLYLVTANHVVSGPTAGPGAAVQVYFAHDRTEPVAAQVLVRNRGLDAALLKVPRPAGLDWTPGTYCSSMNRPAFERGETVWFMRLGRSGRWAPALDNEAGAMRDTGVDPDDRMAFSGIGVRPGVSGSPLVARRGILGMVIQDRLNEGVAVDIERIRRFVLYHGGQWGLGICGEPPPQQTAAAPAPAQSCWEEGAPNRVCRDRMRSGGEGPEMVVLAGGRFRMGSEAEEAFGNESPTREVTVAPFALARHEVTKDEFARFVKAADYRTEAEQGDGCYGWTDSGWKKSKAYSWRNLGFEQGGDHPVACVSWKDANAYLDWLSAETGATYRLPQEAQWEYAVRGGTRTERFWGDDPDDACDFANVRDRSAQEAWGAGDPIHECDDRFGFTAPVGSFEPNPFGIHDGLGNVWEWTCSAYESPFDGSESECEESNNRAGLRVLRGGSWNNFPPRVRSAYRYRYRPGYRLNDLGLRPARIL